MIQCKPIDYVSSLFFSPVKLCIGGFQQIAASRATLYIVCSLPVFLQKQLDKNLRTSFKVQVIVD
jgi:hypothetical protein